MFQHLANLLFPKSCHACGQSLNAKLKDICLECRASLPRIEQSSLHSNPAQKIFQGRLPLKKCTAFLKFEKEGKLQLLMHQLKYKKVPGIGVAFGELAAIELQEYSFFEGIDALIALPIHAKKIDQRGYNQSDLIVKGISNITGIRIVKNALVKRSNTASQTRKSRAERWSNVSSAFQLVDSDQLLHQHVLLVDDIVTTGATAESCGRTLLEVEGLTLSFLSIACTY